MAKDPKRYRVGYAKPPHSGRFQTGKSGNPRGRPRGSLNLATTLTRALLETVTVHERGKPKKLRKLDVAVRQQINKAAAGDPRAFALLTTLLKEVDRPDENKQFVFVVTEDESNL